MKPIHSNGIFGFLVEYEGKEYMVQRTKASFPDDIRVYTKAGNQHRWHWRLINRLGKTARGPISELKRMEKEEV